MRVVFLLVDLVRFATGETGEHGVLGEGLLV